MVYTEWTYKQKIRGCKGTWSLAWHMMEKSIQLFSMLVNRTVGDVILKSVKFALFCLAFGSLHYGLTRILLHFAFPSHHWLSSNYPQGSRFASLIVWSITLDLSNIEQYSINKHNIYNVVFVLLIPILHVMYIDSVIDRYSWMYIIYSIIYVEIYKNLT